MKTLYLIGGTMGVGKTAVEKCPQVGFETDSNHEVYSKTDDGYACAYTARFQSIIGTGKISPVNDLDEKRHGLTVLMRHATQKDSWAFNEKMLNSVAVFKLEVEKFSCKIHE